MSFIADMPGPQFLVLYAAWIAFVAALSIPTRRAQDQTRLLTPRDVPENPDPYELAILRGGSNEAARVAVLELMQRERIEYADGRLLTRGEGDSGPRLGPVQAATLRWLGNGRSVEEVFASHTGLPEQLEPTLAPMRQRLVDEQLLRPADSTPGARQPVVIAWLSVLGLGGYKLLDSLAEGRTNIWGLIVLTIVGLIVLHFAYRLGPQTAHGRRYLSAVHLAFASLRQPGRAARLPKHDPALLLLAGAFGLGALSGTPLEADAGTFKRAQQSGSSCGAGCGSCGGDGGCGGGCGGCGG